MTAPRALFFYGTLRYLPLLEVVVGRVPSTRHAWLQGYGTRAIEGQAHPTIKPSLSARSEGLLVEGLSEEEIARIAYYEGVDDYVLHTELVETSDGALEAGIYVATDHQVIGGDWSFHDWVRNYGAVMVEAAREAMAVKGILSDAEFDAAYNMMVSRAQARLRARAEPAPAKIRGPLGRKDTEILAERHPYTQYFKVVEQDLRFPRFAGGMSEPVTRSAFVGGDAVTLLPYDPVRDRVLLIEQFRFGPHVRHDPRPWLLEPIAGRIDLGETPQDTARREAQEEARLDIGELHEIARYYPSPGTLAEFLISFVGLAELPDASAVIAGAEAEAEDIKGHLVDFDRLMALISTGEAANAPLILSAQWLAVNRGRLRGSP